MVWEDASEDAGEVWIDRNEPLSEPVIFHQVGFLYSITPAAVVLVACIGDDSTGKRTRIPAGMVRQMIELVDGEPIPLPKPKRKRK